MLNGNWIALLINFWSGMDYLQVFLHIVCLSDVWVCIKDCKNMVFGMSMWFEVVTLSQSYRRLFLFYPSWVQRSALFLNHWSFKTNFFFCIFMILATISSPLLSLRTLKGFCSFRSPVSGIFTICSQSLPRHRFSCVHRNDVECGCRIFSMTNRQLCRRVVRCFCEQTFLIVFQYSVAPWPDSLTVTRTQYYLGVWCSHQLKKFRRMRWWLSHLFFQLIFLLPRVVRHRFLRR